MSVDANLFVDDVVQQLVVVQLQGWADDFSSAICCRIFFSSCFALLW